MSHPFAPDCGCAPAPRYYADPCCPPAPCNGDAVISDERYYTLATVPVGRLLTVPLGSKVQAFLKPPTVGGSTITGFAFFGADGQVFCEREPKLTLPIINPKVSTSYPLPPGFQFIICGTGEVNTPWQMVAAPTSGSFFLESVNGQWVLKPTGDIPGLNTIFGNSSGSLSVEVFGFKQVGQNPDGSPIFETRKFVGPGATTLPVVLKFDAATGRYFLTTKAITVVAPGEGDGSDGTIFTGDTIGGSAYVEIDELGVALPNGFAVVPSIDWANVDLAFYDRSLKKFRRAPTWTRVYHPVVNEAPITGLFGAGWHELPGEHGKLSAVVINYPHVAVHISFFFNDQVQFDGARITIDGVAKQEFYTGGLAATGADTQADYHVILQDITPGTHAIAFEFQKTADFTVGRKILRSHISVHSVL